MSFKLGQQGEKCVQKLLKKFDIECQINEDYKKRYDYDLVSDYKNKKVTYEVKYDYMAEKTGNLAIEINNCKADKPSGINVTKANIWAHVVRDKKNMTVWMAKVSELKKFIKKTTPFREVTQAGDGNADLLLYKTDAILGPLFVRVDNISKSKFLKYLVNMIGKK